MKSVRVLLRLVLGRFREDHCLQVAGELTFTTLLALVPLFTIAFALFAAFPVFEDWSNAFKVFLLTTLEPETSGKVITVYMQQFSDNAAQLTAIGLIFLAVTALALMLTIERVFNAIWRVPRQRPILQRLVIFWAVLTVGPLLIGASLSLTSWLVTQSMSVTADVKELQGVMLKMIPVLLNAAAFALVYLVMPNRRVAIRNALIGGVAAAIAFEVMKRGFALYIQLFPTYALIYGAFATVPIFLLWIYLSWTVVLFGAVVVAVLPRWRSGVAERDDTPGAHFFLALNLVEALFRQLALGQAPSTSQLAALAGSSEELTERMLERMRVEGWIRRVDPAGWVLSRDLATLRVMDFYRAFVISVQRAEQPNGVIVREVGEILRSFETPLDVSLRSLIEAEARRDDSQEPSSAGASRPCDAKVS